MSGKTAEIPAVAADAAEAFRELADVFDRCEAWKDGPGGVM